MEDNNIKLDPENRISSVETWVKCNGTPWPIIFVERRGEVFSSKVGDPNGGSSKSGTLPEVLVGLHPSVIDKYQKLFSIRNTTPATIAEAGFEGYAII